jgi:hypothetical protein
MRAYLPISLDALDEFIQTGVINVDSIYAPTPFYAGANEDLDEEEIEYLLSLEAAEAALAQQSSGTSPGIVLAIELTSGQVNQVEEKTLTLNSELKWEQVQCALLLYPGEDELIWFATQEIALNLAEWK